MEREQQHTLLLILGIVLVSTSAIFIKLSEAPSSILGMYRMIFAAIAMLPIIFFKRKEFQSINAKEWLQLLGSGFFLALHFLLWFQSLKLTTVASSTIILALQPLVSIIGGYFFFKEKTSLLSLISVCVAIIGVGIIGFGDFSLSHEAILGDILSFLSVISVVLYLLLGQSVVKKVSHWVYTFSVFSVAAFTLFLYNIATSTKMTGYSTYEWGVFLALALVPTLAHVIHNYLLHYMNATTISMSILGEPVGASLLAWVILNETFTLFQIIGGVFVIFGVYLFLRLRRAETVRTDIELTV